jgi:TldD protein
VAGTNSDPASRIDPGFTAYPLRELAAAALQRAAELGAGHADFRAERILGQQIALSDGHLQTLFDADDLGLAVRVVIDGTWGFASAVDMTVDAAVRAASDAVAAARVAAAMNTERIELADEPGYGDVAWVSSYVVDPFDAPLAEKVALLTQWSSELLAHPQVSHVDASLRQVRECKFYSDGDTTSLQQRVRVHPSLTAVSVQPDGRFETMRTLAPPAGRGLEYLGGSPWGSPGRGPGSSGPSSSGPGANGPGANGPGANGAASGCWDFPAELAAIPGLLAEKLAAPSVEPGRYDLVVDPTNLWLTIHESIGHATELDRALGYEASYAGTSFATLDKLGSLQYGSQVMHVTGDRTAEHGLATIGYDDEGVAAQSWDLVTGGVFTGYQLDRRMARMRGFGRSNGCAFADSPAHMPIQRMANVSLQPAPGGPTTGELIAGVEDGIYVAGDKSWSIDMQRYNFQFTGQRFYRISHGQLAGQLRDVAYQATTTQFWNSLQAVGGPRSYLLGGAFNCGKGQPGQIAPVSHGCPAALFRGVRILNTAREGR